MHLVGFVISIYLDARSHEFQKVLLCISGVSYFKPLSKDYMVHLYFMSCPRYVCVLSVPAMLCL